MQTHDDQSRPRPLATASTLNPSAGQHAVTGDAREVAAADRAGERSWSTWPYYERRYGERGRRFTRSDSAWIATLPGMSAAAVERQVRWLATLLAARGMPRLLLEHHLRVLHEELVAAEPERASEYAVLLHAEQALRTEREGHMPAAEFETIERQFQELLGAPGHDDLRAGALIAAAIADERAGEPRAVASLVEWLTDPQLFPPEWIAAVDQTVRGARTLAAEPWATGNVTLDDEDRKRR